MTRQTPEQRVLQLINAKRRSCFSMHDCCLCSDLIRYTHQYYDAGFNKRAHVHCVLKFICIDLNEPYPTVDSTYVIEAYRQKYTIT